MRDRVLFCILVAPASFVFVALAACSADPAAADALELEAGAVDDAKSRLDAAGGDGAPGDASGDVGQVDSSAASDATTDARDASDAALAVDACKATPQSCLSAGQTCANNCKVTYNICVNNCPSDANLMNCVNQCKSNQTTCKTPCKRDCVTCANQNGSCTGTPECQATIDPI